MQDKWQYTAARVYQIHFLKIVEIFTLSCMLACLINISARIFTYRYRY